MNKHLETEKELRGVERDIMWNQQVFAGSHDPSQKERVKARLVDLEEKRKQIKARLAA